MFRIIVGAPEGQTNQPGVTKGGTVYRCDARVADSCYQIQFDQKGTKNPEIELLPSSRTTDHVKCLRVKSEYFVL